MKAARTRNLIAVLAIALTTVLYYPIFWGRPQRPRPPPVSYTHLDVYKRQVLVQAVFV